MPDAARWGAVGRNGIADVVGMLPVRGLLSVRWCCGLRPVPSCCPPSPPGGHGGGGPGVQCRGARCRRVLLLVPALPAGRGKFLRRASPSWAGAPVGCLPGGLAVGAAVVVQRAAICRASASFFSTVTLKQTRRSE